MYELKKIYIVLLYELKNTFRTHLLHSRTDVAQPHIDASLLHSSVGGLLDRVLEGVVARVEADSERAVDDAAANLWFECE